MKKLYILSCLSVFALSGSAIAGYGKDAKDKKAMAKPTTEQRTNMAKVHEDFAACLRTNKEFGDCKTAMWKKCEELGKEGCPMMGKGKHSWGEKDRYSE